MSKSKRSKKYEGFLDAFKDLEESTFLPLAKSAMATTLSSSLVSVSPIGGDPNLEAEVKQINRQRKIEAVIEDKEYKEMKVEDHPDYKTAPKGELFYLDFKYSGPSDETTDDTGRAKRKTSKKKK